MKTINVPALVCKDPKSGTGTEELVSPDLTVATTDSNRSAPGDNTLYDTRLMLYSGAPCPTDYGSVKAVLDFRETGGAEGHLKGLVAAIPAADNECAAAAHNQNWDTNFDIDVRNLDGKTVCAVYGSDKVYAVTVRIDHAHTSDPRLPALQLQLKPVPEGRLLEPQGLQTRSADPYRLTTARRAGRSPASGATWPQCRARPNPLGHVLMRAAGGDEPGASVVLVGPLGRSASRRSVVAADDGRDEEFVVADDGGSHPEGDVLAPAARGSVACEADGRELP